MGNFFSDIGNFFFPSMPTLSTPPPPPSSVMYDENGGVLSRQVFDPATNEYRTYGPGSEPARPATEWADRITGNYEQDMRNPIVKAEVEKRYQQHVQNDPKGVKRGHSGGWREEEYRNMVKEGPQAYQQYLTELDTYNKDYTAWQQGKDARSIEDQNRNDIRSQAISNLNELSPERQKQIEEFGTAFADSMHRDVDPRFQKVSRDIEESMNAKGMTGSRAYVDLSAELAKDRMQTDASIASQASMAKEQLLSNDRSFWANILDQIDAGKRSDLLTKLQANKTNSDMTAQNYAGTLGFYNAQNDGRLADWESRQKRGASLLGAGTNLASGLLFLYGQKKGDSGGVGGGGGGSSSGGFGLSALQPTSTSAGSFSLT